MSEVTSGRDLGPNEVIDCDVVVVGSGGGGGPAVYELARAGLDAVCLEAGPHIKPEQMSQRELDSARRVYVDGGAQGPADGSLQLLQGRAIGGSTLVNGEVCFRTPEFVLEEWMREFGVEGMSPEQMAPVFDEVEKMINVTVNQGRFLDAATATARGLAAMGLEAKPISRNVKDCKGCCYCFFGCAYGCKQSTDQSYLPAALEAGARIIADAEVTKIQLEGDRARGVVARTPAGNLVVRARAVVLACGAIASPLLLLDHGLGGDQVGRHLAVHPVLLATGIFQDRKPDRVSAMISAYTDHWMKDGILIELASGSTAFMAQGVPGFGRAHKELARDVQHNWGAGLVLRDRTAPGRVKRDRKGRKVIDYELDPATRAILRKSMKISAELYFAAGAKKVYFPTTEELILESKADIARLDETKLGPADILLISYHPQGTVRLNTCTDNDGQVKGTRDLYVMDTSLFPTPVAVNPQVSVMAVATVLARRLAKRVASA